MTRSSAPLRGTTLLVAVVVACGPSERENTSDSETSNGTDSGGEGSTSGDTSGDTSNGDEDSTGSDPTSTGDDAPDPPCEWDQGTPGQTVSLQAMHDGEARTFELHLPTDYDCTPRPVVVGLHGYYGSGAGFQNNTSQMTERIDELGYIGIFPDGLPMGNGWQAAVTSFNDIDSHNSDGPDGPTCTMDAYDYDIYDNCRPEESADACNWGTSCADDEGFIRGLIQTSFAEWSGDEGRVLLTGFSQGGQSTQSLAWRLSDVVTVAAPHHGFSANGYTQSPASKMSLFQVWATGDDIVNGAEVPSSDGMIYDGADETAQVWANGQACDADTSPYPTPFDGIEGWSCAEHANCQTGASVVTCVWQGGHTWGRIPGTNFALEAMLTFFAAQTP
ncbi:MAG: dienelactone hydrolase family protein [Nannocystaceae bacterium]